MSPRDWLRRLLGRAPEEGGGAARPEMISCREALSAVYEYLDGELDGTPAEKVREHFEACQRCYPHLRLEESFRAAIRHASGSDRPPPGLRERVLDAVYRARAE